MKNQPPETIRLMQVCLEARDSGRRYRLVAPEALAVARLVLDDVERYGGEGALLVEWSRMMLSSERSMVERLKARAGLEEPKEAA